MKVLAITNLFPNNKQPGRGIFNKQQFLELSTLLDLTVVAPLPWAPKVGLKGERGIMAQIVDEEVIEGIDVYHPRYFLTPKVGRSFYGRFMYWGIKKCVHALHAQHKFDKILATWAYPDAYAAALISEELKIPLVVKVHGTDINVTSQSPTRRKKMVWAFQKAEKVIAVSEKLKEKIVGMGIAKEKISLIPNGVNDALFKLMDKQECKARFDLENKDKLLVYIGNLVSIKGVNYLVEAFKQLPADYHLQIIGDGLMFESLKKEAEQFDGRIQFQGRISHKEIPYWLNAADVFCLPSLNEGCPNVVLEALACGTPVVASRVGGVPDLINDDENGMMVEPKNPAELGRAIIHVMNRQKNGKPMQTTRQTLSWRDNAEAVYKILNPMLPHGELER